MKEYKDYNLEDFLLDDDFRRWVTQGLHTDDLFWTGIANGYQGKKAVMAQARELILTWDQHTANLSETELEKAVNLILDHSKKSTTSIILFPGWKWIAAAATILLAIGIGWGVMTKPAKTPSVTSYKESISQISAPLHEVINKTSGPMRVKLPDGSAVKLTPSSRISYRDNPFIQDKKREIYLSGEAFFEVRKDSQNPFFVYANGLMTRVVGTSFLIKTTDTNVEVVVRSGRVSVMPIKDKDSQAKRNTELLLTPNQQALFSTRDNLISKSIITLPLEINKTTIEPDFVFENQPINKVFAALEKVYGIPIMYDNAVMQNCSLRVALSNEPFFSKLDIICKTIGASYRVIDGQVIISSEGCE